MSRRPGVELAFTDDHGQNRVRYADGTLAKLRQSPAAYYGLEPPLGWLEPQKTSY